MKIVAIIPARMGSSRFPGKPLAKILGKSMIEHVYIRASMSGVLDDVFIATPDEEIRREVERFGGKAIMTSPRHERASDRVAEAAEDMRDCDIVINLQGDEPLIHPEMINLAAEPLIKSKEVVCSNLVKRIESESEYMDYNTIKVVADKHMNALYFSREPIPTKRILGFSDIPIYKQVCVIPFRRDFLLKYSRMKPTPLEQAESIDMLRILEHGYKVKLVESGYDTHAVDTKKDLLKVESIMKSDKLYLSYAKRT
jgi:3-deoxy-manno-octulosonate cytidylyltransferase (CMP-KDO synthetase)